ncbi:hypothetical protein E2C01_090407 [Portunus trituberculatus]|uniref:Uncharacterized protein n=1 Tax=Portunus trituberculatus TaxID=210409 RepID=A0A5B7JLQ5_PORTR|nr:hypothetical protein [Portunus trituberculatus]
MSWQQDHRGFHMGISQLTTARLARKLTCFSIKIFNDGILYLLYAIFVDENFSVDFLHDLGQHKSKLTDDPKFLCVAHLLQGILYFSLKCLAITTFFHQLSGGQEPTL